MSGRVNGAGGKGAGGKGAGAAHPSYEDLPNDRALLDKAAFGGGGEDR